jgi:hypothetical protein
MKMDILGTEYEYSEATEKDDSELIDISGYTDHQEKKVTVSSEIESEYMKQKIARHEIIHAYLHECGLDKYNSDEIIVDWMASMFPKLLRSFQHVFAIEDTEKTYSENADCNACAERFRLMLVANELKVRADNAERMCDAHLGALWNVFLNEFNPNQHKSDKLLCFFCVHECTLDTSTCAKCSENYPDPECWEFDYRKGENDANYSTNDR